MFSICCDISHIFSFLCEFSLILPLTQMSATFFVLGLLIASTIWMATAASGPVLLILVCFLFFYSYFFCYFSLSLSLCIGLLPALKSISLNAFQQFAADTGSDDADSPQDIHFTTSMVALLGSFLNMWGILRYWLQRVQWKYGKTCWIYKLCYSENIVKLVRYIIIFILRSYVRI